MGNPIQAMKKNELELCIETEKLPNYGENTARLLRLRINQMVVALPTRLKIPLIISAGDHGSLFQRHRMQKIASAAVRILNPHA